MYSVGEKVWTTYGPATVLGFERFTKAGECAPLSQTDDETTSRVVCKLDDPSRWIATAMTPNPYMMRHNMRKLEGAS